MKYIRHMNKVLIIFLIISSLLFARESDAQMSVRDSSLFAPLIDLSYSLKVPGGDMALSFGPSSEIGIAMMFKTKSNLLFGVDFNYLFGDQVIDESFADGFRDDKGFILATNGLYSEVYFTERGFSVSGKFGVIIPVWSPNPNSGIMILGGVGILQHKIKIEDRFNEVKMLSSDGYYQGYDRLSNGVMFTQFIGYRLLSNRRLINVFGGLEFSQALTKNRRDLNFDTGLKDDKTRTDLLSGFRVGITIPLYKQVAKDFYYR